MKAIRALLAILCVAAILAGAVYGMRRIAAYRDAAQKSAAGRRSTAVTVRTGKVGQADLRNVLTFNGDIEAIRTVDIMPRVSGRLLKLELEDGRPVEEGVYFREGTLIARLDDREYHAKLSSAKAAVSQADAAVSQAQAGLASAKAAKSSAEAALIAAKAELEQQRSSLLSAKAAVASAQASFADKERERKRQQNLVDKKAATQQSLDQAITAFDQAVAALRRAEADQQTAEARIASADAAIAKSDAAVQQSDAAVQQAAAGLKQAEAAREKAKAQEEEAQLNYDETRIYAPMNGIISKKHIDPGAMVSSTTPIVSQVSIATVKVVISIPVNHLSHIIPKDVRLRDGKPAATPTTATLRTAALPGRAIDCTVEKIYPTVNAVTRTAQVEFRVQNIRGDQGMFMLRPGMYATVELLLEERKQVTAVDIALPVRNRDRQLVYVCEGDHVKAVPVKLGVRFGDLVEITEGLKPGQEIVTQGQHRLTDGAAIQRVND